MEKEDRQEPARRAKKPRRKQKKIPGTGMAVKTGGHPGQTEKRENRKESSKRNTRKHEKKALGRKEVQARRNPLTRTRQA